MNFAAFRSLALALPEASEEPHFDMTSFRVRRKIFATVPPQGDVAHIFVGEDDVRSSVTADPTVFEELWWGKKLSGLRVRLPAADADYVAELLEDAWRRKAPKRLVAG